MANVVTLQVIENGFRNYIITGKGILDTSDVAKTDLIDTTAVGFQTGNRDYSGQPYTVKVKSIQFAIEDSLVASFYWNATSDILLATVAGRGCLEYNPPLENNGGSGKTGKVLYEVTGWSGSAVLSYSFIVTCIKAYR